MSAHLDRARADCDAGRRRRAAANGRFASSINGEKITSGFALSARRSSRPPDATAAPAGPTAVVAVPNVLARLRR